MRKNIALFIDGTGNDGEPDARLDGDTNVYKLHMLCNDLNFYQRGVGSKRGDVLGSIAGFGTKKRLKKAYSFLIKHYERGDNIFIFGFSRGAFAARLFAGFLGYVGTLFGKPEWKDYLPHMYQIYESSVVLNVVGQFQEYLGSLGQRTTALPIHFLGVWDTVERYFPKRDLPEIERLPTHITHGRHALAIHERRAEMEPTLWKKWDPKQTVKQVWFPGAHSDVGGGYSQSKLANAALHWMYQEAKGCRLDVREPATSNEKAILHQQRTANKLIGRLLSKLEGEQIRDALGTNDPILLSSMGLSTTARDHLGSHPITDIVFLNYPKKERISALRELKQANRSAHTLMKRIDDLARTRS